MNLRRLRNVGIGLVAGWFTFFWMDVIVYMFVQTIPFLVIVIMAVAAFYFVGRPLTVWLDMRDLASENDRKAQDKYD